MADGRGRGGRGRTRRRAESCGCGVRPIASIGAPTATLVVIDYKTGSERSYKVLSHDEPVTARARICSCRSTRTRRGPRSAHPTPRSRRTTGSSGRGKQPAHRLRRRRRGRRRLRDHGAHASSTASKAGVFPAAAGRARADAVHPVPLLRSRRHGHDRSVAGMATQVRRARARRVSSSLSDPWRPARDPLPNESTASDRPTRPVRRSSATAPRATRSRTELDATLFVEAGAGTGKTKALVDRVVALVTRRRSRSPGPDGGDRRDHLHREGRGRAARPRPARAADAGRRRRQPTELVRARCRSALDDLDGAAICTLHSFAQRILTEFPIEIGSAAAHRGPRRDLVAYRVRSALARVRRRAARRSRARVDVLVLLASDVKLAHLRTVAEKLDDNWDLLDRIEAPRAAPGVGDRRLARRVRRGVRCAATTCRADDRQVAGASAPSSPSTATDCAPRSTTPNASSCCRRRSRRSRWAAPATARTGTTSTPCATRIVKLGEQRKAMTDAVLDVAIKRVVAAIAVYIERSVAERRVSGELDFHDLLVLARTLLRDPEHGAPARARLWERYHRILIDEFQDTDPIQVELAALLGSDDPDRRRPSVGGDERRSRAVVLRRRSEAVDLPLPPGRHRHVPRGRGPVRARRAPVPHVQLPDRAAGARLDQPRVQRADPAVPGLATRVPPPRCRPATVPRRERPRRRAAGCRAARRRRHRRPAICARGKRPTSPRSPALRSPSDGRSTTRTATSGVRPASATCASCCRRARRSDTSSRRSRDARHPVPRRDQLARLQQSRGARPA